MSMEKRNVATKARVTDDDDSGIENAARIIAGEAGQIVKDAQDGIESMKKAIMEDELAEVRNEAARSYKQKTDA